MDIIPGLNFFTTNKIPPPITRHILMTDTVTQFEQFSLIHPILQVLQEIGYESPTPIQTASIPHLLNGDDLLGQAQTGTGKTAAFALPLLNQLDLTKKQPQILVLTPTRELAIQVAEAFQTYARHLKGFHILPIYGGQSMEMQLRQLKRGVQVVVGTPGRVMDHLRRQSLSLKSLKSLVLDEADEMLNMGFLEDVEWILEHTPPTRQIALFSATMPEAIRRVAHRYLHDPKEIKIKSATTTVPAIEQRYWQVSGLHKLDALTRILEVEEFDATLIFVRTKTETVELAEKLEARGFASSALNGDMNQALRERTIEQLKNNSIDIVVATDVAARGLDVTRITHVINYDIPYDTEAYVHRIGRTGRAGRKGSAILFVAPREMRMLRAIEKATKQPIERMQLPSSEAISNRRIAQFKQQIQQVLESQDLNFLGQVVNQFELEKNISAQEIAAALAYLVQRERPLQIKEHKPPQEKTQKSKSGKAKPPEKRPRSKQPADVEMVTFRIEVGRNQGAMPKDIVGAIANEADIDSQYIGHIKLYDDYSTVELPDGMPKDIFQHLKKVRVREHKLNISRETSEKPAPRYDSKKRSSSAVKQSEKKQGKPDRKRRKKE